MAANTGGNIDRQVVVHLKLDGRDADVGWGRSSQGVNQFGSAIKSTKDEVAGLERGMDNLRTGLANAFSGSGLGALGNIVSIGSIPALLATAGLIVGQAMRMAYEFERVSTVAAANLRIGTGQGVASALADVKAASYAGIPYGYNQTTMARALGALSSSAGIVTPEAVQAAPWIAKYSRAYMMEPSTVASTVGSFMAQAGNGLEFHPAAEALFGGAENAGRLGTRIQEFIGTATNVLSMIQLSNLERNPTAQEVVSRITGITQAGGWYDTSAGVTATVGAQNALMGGMSGDVRRALIAKRAGVSDYDIMLGNAVDSHGGSNSQKVFKELLKEYGNYGDASYGKGTHNLEFIAALVSQVGEQQAKVLLGEADRRGGRTGGGPTKPPFDLNALLKTSLDTPLSVIDRAITDVTATIIDKADEGLTAMSGWLGKDIPNHLKQIEIALGILAAVGVAGSLGMLRGAPGLVAGIGRTLGGALDAAGEGIAGASILGVLATVLTPFLMSGPTGKDDDASIGLSQQQWQTIRNMNKKGEGSAYGVPIDTGDYRAGINFDLTHTYGGTTSADLMNPNRHVGMTANLRVAMDDALKMGWSLGISTISQGTHEGGPNDPHYRGNAMDIAVLNGMTVGSKAAIPYEKIFANEVLKADPQARIGTAGLLYDYLKPLYGNRIISDSSNHIHLEGGSGPAPVEISSESGWQQWTQQTVNGRLEIVMKAKFVANPPDARKLVTAPTSKQRANGHGPQSQTGYPTGMLLPGQQGYRPPP